MKIIDKITAASTCWRAAHLKSALSASPPLVRSASRWMLGLGMALCVGSAVGHAQTWETVDDVDAASASARVITTDGAGNLFVAGSVRDETTRQHAMMMKSSDGGVTWDTAVDLPSINDAGAPNGSAAAFSALAAAQVTGGENHLVAAGRIKRVPFGSTFTGQWLVIRSKDAGATWETVDEYSHPTYSQLSSNTFPGGVAVDSSGTIYVTGAAEEKIVKGTKTTVYNHWLIRKGVPNATGVTWTTVGDFPSLVSSDWETLNSPVTGVACVGNNVFVVGGGGGSWQVRKSSNGGATWTLVDSFRFSSSDNSHAYGIAADSAGNLYVAGLGGQTVRNASRPYWVVRKGTGAGTSWSTVDLFQYPSGSAQAYGVTVDGSDNVLVTGTAWAASSSLRHWITRQRSAVTGVWSTTDDFSLATNGYAQGKAVAADSLGTQFSTGSASDSAGGTRGWLVRRKLAP